MNKFSFKLQTVQLPAPKVTNNRKIFVTTNVNY